MTRLRSISCLLFMGASAVLSHAQALAPSNLPEDTCTVPGQGNLMVVGTLVLDTNSDCDSVVEQGAPDICMLKFVDVQVGPAATVSITGTRALALVATGSIVIAGRIDAAANGAADGPGASPSGTGGSGTTSSGGGGGGHGTSGAQGGANVGFIAAPGGATSGTPMLVPLRGGARGGAGGTGALGSAPGGGAGGGLQLVSCATLTIGAGGVIEAGGGGGRGALAMAAPGGGGGGGSGGGILVEAVDIAVHGTLAANGGGGGEGATTINSGTHGSDGAASLAFAPGGSGGTAAGGDGGSGATGLVAAAPGSSGSGSASSGGGGGGVGYIRINVPPNGSVDLTGALITPAHTAGTAGLTDLIFSDGFE